jgi:hypothetical protein
MDTNFIPVLAYTGEGQRPRYPATVGLRNKRHDAGDKSRRDTTMLDESQ